MEISKEYKERIVAAALAQRSKFTGTGVSYASRLEIPASVWSQMKSGKNLDGLLSTTKWVNMARILGVTRRERKWNTARTLVYDNLEASMTFCKEFSKAMMMVDDCGIGKSWCAKHIAKGMKDTFYIDCSQAPNKLQFIKAIAKAIGIDTAGYVVNIKANIKHYLSMLDNPLIVLDEAGDLEYSAFMVIKELWNGTDGYCGWYMLGADGLRRKIEQGINHKKVGYAEIFSRFSDEFVRVTPVSREDKIEFKKQLVRQVAEANCNNPELIPQLVRKCLDKDSTLRYLDTLIKLAD